MTFAHRSLGWLVVAVTSLAAPGARAQAASPCAGQAMCTAVTEFTATITDFRTSVAGAYRITSAVMQFQNRTTHPLILGYVPQSGIVTDDQGNRYVIGGADNVRGIGAITGSQFDPKFVLQPGESSDARFEFVWRPDARSIIGTTFEMDLAIREIVPINANQFQLGKEHALHFDRLANATVAAASSAPGTVVSAAPGAVVAASAGAGAAAAATPAPAAAAAPAPAPAPANACGDTPHCFGAGPFVASVARFTAAAPTSGSHTVLVTLEFRNVGSQPIILAYKAHSGLIVDNYGNRYYWGRAGTVDQSAKGIGMVNGTRADPQFALQPGQSRQATFQLTRYNVGKTAIGTGFSYDLEIEQLGVLPSNQLQSLRDYSLSFSDLASSGPSAAAAGSSLLDALKKKLKKP